MDIASVERSARCLLHPVLFGPEADRAVAAIVAWTAANPDADTPVRERAWERIGQLTARHDRCRDA
jgi:hypothetical protein